MSLHDRLQELADRAPDATVPDDTWQRARRSRRRDRVGVVLAAAVVVALAVGVVGLVRSTEEPPVADTGGSVPSRIWWVPVSRDVEVAPTPAVGPVGAAFLTDGFSSRVVTVSAVDGEYRQVELPDFSGRQGANAAEQYLALTPDGTRLAFSWAAEPNPDGPTPTGIRVVDLETGDLRSIRLEGGRGILVNRMSWSPDGEWLVWSGQVSTKWTAGGRSFGDEEAAGLVAPGGTTSTPLPPPTDPDGVRQYAVGDDGTVAILDTHRLAWWRDGAEVAHQPIELGSTYSSQAFVGDGYVRDVRMPYRADAIGPTFTRHVEGRARATVGQLPAALVGAAPLGFDADGAAFVEARETLDSNAAVYRLDLVAGGGATYEKVVTEEDGSLQGLTVAVGLPVDEDVTPPDWVDDGGPSPWWWVAGGAALLALATLALLLIRRRARRPR